VPVFALQCAVFGIVRRRRAGGGKVRNAIERSILGRFAADALKEYGDRPQGLYVFDYLFEDCGEGDESGEDDGEVSVDLDVAVVLADGDWSYLDEKKRLVSHTFDILLATDVLIRAWPLPASAWHDPSTYRNPSLVRLMKRRGA
jgi:hypothetical protein